MNVLSYYLRIPTVINLNEKGKVENLGEEEQGKSKLIFLTAIINHGPL